MQNAIAAKIKNAPAMMNVPVVKIKPAIVAASNQNAVLSKTSLKNICPSLKKVNANVMRQIKFLYPILWAVSVAAE